MTKVTNASATESRKLDHILINLEKDVQFPRLTTGLERYRFLHQALPELNLTDIDTRLTVFGKPLSSPILISSMTGGTDMARGDQSQSGARGAATRDRHGLGVRSAPPLKRAPSPTVTPYATSRRTFCSSPTLARCS